MLKLIGRASILVLAFCFAFCGFAQAQTPLTKSPWCEKFDHTSRDHQLKATVIQVKPAGGQPDNDLINKFKLSELLKSTLKAAKDQTPEQLVATLVESLRPANSDERNPRSHLPMLVSGRPGEAKLKPADMLADQGDDAFKPVGFFNRFDQAQFKEGHCGEARIVYAKTPQSTPALRRMLLIFEGKVSPKEELKEVTELDCRRVAEFWASLIEASGTSRAETLRKFFLEGDMGSYGKLHTAPMSYENLGGSNRGQVRGNLFVEGPTNPWQLREWLLKKHGDRLSFDLVTVKDNPLAEFYDAAKLPTLLEKERGAAEFRAFQQSFVDQMTDGLATDNAVPKGPAVDALPATTRMFNGFGFGPGATSQYDEFQSTSQGFEDLPNADQDFSKNVQDKLTAKGVTHSAAHIFNRAMALTCQGCHQPEGISRDPRRLEIASNTFWPKSLEFVHIDEDSQLSPALLQAFLPFRAAMLKDHLCKEVAPSAPASATILSLGQEAAPASGAINLQGLKRLAEEAPSPIQRAIAQEAVNDQELARRRIERSAPGSLWPLRRTH